MQCSGSRNAKRRIAAPNFNKKKKNKKKKAKLFDDDDEDCEEMMLGEKRVQSTQF
jgi:hypothetical protein